MKNYKQILEAINRGIKFALDDFEDQDELQGQVNSKVKYQDGTKEWLDLMEEVVDLGLPSGTLWCKYNLEAYPNLDPHPFASDFYGNYYSWGETKVKNEYSINTLTFFINNDRGLIKYCNKDNLTQLLPEDDAAYQIKTLYNFKFYVPSKEQCEELLKYTESHVVAIPRIKNLNGVLFTSKINGNKLFFPLSGFKTGQLTKFKCIEGGIWTSTLATNITSSNIQLDYHKAYFLHFDADFSQSAYAYIDTDYRGRGLNIRPVINL